MKKEVEKYIIALKEIQNPDILNEYDLSIWKGKAINIVSRIYGKDSVQEGQINGIRFDEYMIPSVSLQSFRPRNIADYCREQAIKTIEGLISDLSTFGLPEKNDTTNKGGINISASQNQTISVNVIWESVKAELTGKQLKEIEAIIEDKDENFKVDKIFDKLKSFGADLAAKIIASILTNPAVLGE